MSSQTPEKGKFTTQQEIAIRLLADGWSTAEVGAQLKVTDRTIRYWRAKVFGFKEAVDEAIRESAVDFDSSVKGLLPKALRKLVQILDKEDTKTSDYLATIRIIGDWAGARKVPQQIASENGNSELDIKEYLRLRSQQQEEGR